MEKKNEGRDVGVISVLFFVLAALLINWRHVINADEGVILNGAYNLFLGRVVYRDFFEFIGPASFYLVLLPFKIFGPSYNSALAASIVFLILSCYLIFRTGTAIHHDREAAFLTAVLWLMLSCAKQPLINHNTFSSFAGVAFLYLFIQFMHKKTITWSLLGGTAAAAIFFINQPKGVATLLFGAGFLLYLTAQGEADAKGLVSFVAGAVPVLLAGLIFWGTEPLTNVTSIAVKYVRMNHLTASYLPVTFFFLIVIGLALLLLRDGQYRGAVIFLSLFQFLLLFFNFYNPSLFHVRVNCFPSLVLVGILISAMAERSLIANPYRRIRLLLTFLLVVYAAIIAVQNREETRWNEAVIARLKSIVGGEKIFSFPFLPNLYLELGKEDPYYNDVLFTAQHPEEHFLRNREILARENPMFIISSHSLVERYGQTFDNPIDRYIQGKYVPFEDCANLKVWRRRAVTGPAGNGVRSR
jgi:hypothetical protein